MSSAIGTSVEAGYRTLFETIRNRILNRRVTIRLERGALRMTVTEFQAPMELRSLSVGRLGEVRIAAEDIDWNGYALQRAQPCCTTYISVRLLRRSWSPRQSKCRLS